MRRAARRLCAALIVALSLGVAAVAVAEPAYLAEMPTVAKVRGSIQGATPLDTLAFQAAVFDTLQQILQTRTERPGALANPASLTAGERAVLASYQAATREIYATPGIDRGDLLSAGQRFQATPRFEDQVAAQFFSTAWLADYAGARRRFQAAYDRAAGTGAADTRAGSKVPAPPGADEPKKPGFLDRVIHGPGGETATVRNLVTGSTKVLGALVILALLAVRHLRRKTGGE